MKDAAAGDLRTPFRVRRRTLLVDLGRPRPVLSSAPRGGGLRRARYVLNHQVPPNPRVAPLGTRRWEDPARSLGRIAAALGVSAPFVGLMTAVPLRHLIALREEREGLWVEVLATVGVTNAVRAGEPAPEAGTQGTTARAGTINLILITNARLAASAMVSAVQVATESKTAVLLAEGVPSSVSGAAATGTGTDATVIVSGSGPAARYSGTHTPVGMLIGRLVGEAVSRGLRIED